MSRFAPLENTPDSARSSHSSRSRTRPVHCPDTESNRAHASQIAVIWGGDSTGGGVPWGACTLSTLRCRPVFRARWSSIGL